MLQAPIRSEDSKAFNVAKKFYRACLNETAIAREGLEKIKQIFELIGGWPTLKGYNWKEETFDWTEALHKLRELGLNFDVFFRITVDRDQGGERATRGSRYILQVSLCNIWLLIYAPEAWVINSNITNAVSIFRLYSQQDWY